MDHLVELWVLFQVLVNVHRLLVGFQIHAVTAILGSATVLQTLHEVLLHYLSGAHELRLTLFVDVVYGFEENMVVLLSFLRVLDLEVLEWPIDDFLHQSLMSPLLRASGVLILVGDRDLGDRVHFQGAVPLALSRVHSECRDGLSQVTGWLQVILRRFSEVESRLSVCLVLSVSDVRLADLWQKEFARLFN